MVSAAGAGSDGLSGSAATAAVEIVGLLKVRERPTVVVRMGELSRSDAETDCLARTRRARLTFFRRQVSLPMDRGRNSLEPVLR
jgi:hypothetical protein